MDKQPQAKPVERMFRFVLAARILLIGRETLRRSKSRLHFVLITHDLSERSRAEVLTDYAHYPVVQHYTSEELEKHFGLKGSKVIGFAKSGLAKSIYAELKQHRINKPVTGQTNLPPGTTASPSLPPESPPTPPTARTAGPGFPSRRRARR